MNSYYEVIKETIGLIFMYWHEIIVKGEKQNIE